jgi:hypothetical protein
MSRRSYYGTVSALILLAAVVSAQTITADFLYGLRYRIPFEVVDTTASDTVRVDSCYETVFYTVDLPTQPCKCRAFRISAFTEVLSEFSPTGVLVQVWPLSGCVLFAFDPSTFWGQWATYRPPPDTGWMRCGSPDTAIVDERNAYLLNRDRPDAVRLVIGVRGYPGHTHRVRRVEVVWTCDGDAVTTIPAPSGFEMLPCYPNPFNAVLTIPVAVAIPGPVEIYIYDVLGRRVETINGGLLTAGQHRFQWSSDAPSGQYFVKAVSPGYSPVRRVTLIR